MTPYVVDASVAVKWYLPEVHDVHSKRLLNANWKFTILRCSVTRLVFCFLPPFLYSMPEIEPGSWF